MLAVAAAAAWGAGGAWALRSFDPRLATALLTSIAAVAALGVVATRARRACGSDGERRADELEALCVAAMTMGASTDLVTTAEQTLDLLCAVTRMDAGAVYRLDAASRRLALVASRGIAGDGLAADPLADVGGAIANARAVVLAAPVLARLAREAWTSGLAVPIPVNEGPWGVLVLLARARRSVDADGLTMLQAAGRQLGAAIARTTLFAEAQAKSRRLEALTRLNQTLTTTLSTDEVLRRVVDAAIELCTADVARLWLVDEDGSAVSLRATAGAGGDAPAVTRGPVGEGLVGTIVAERRAACAADVGDDPRVRPIDGLGPAGCASFAGVPLHGGDRVLGVLGVATRGRHEYTEEEMALLASLANQAAIAMDNARLFLDQWTRRAHLDALLDINAKIGALAPTEGLLTLIAEEAARLLHVDNAGFRLLQGDELVLAGLAGSANLTMLRERLRVGESVSGRALAAGQTLVFDLDTVSGLIPEHRAAAARLGYRTLLAVPLKVGDRAIGVLTFRTRGAFTARDRELAEAFAGLAAIALEHARLVREAGRRGHEAQELARLARTLTESLDVSAVVGRTVDSVLTLFAAQSSILRVLQADGSLVALGVGGHSREHIQPGHVTAPGVGLLGQAVTQGRAIMSPDVLTDPRVTLSDDLRRAMVAVGGTALLAVPMRAEGTTIGVLGIADHGGRVFSEDEASLLQAFADQATLALENARLYEDARRSAERLRALEQVNRLVSSSLNTAEVLANLARAIAEFFDAPHVSLWGFDEATRRVRRSLVHGDARLAAVLRDDLALGEGAEGWVVAHREPILWTDARADARCVDADTMARHGLPWLAAYPIAMGDRVLGAFSVSRASAPAMTPETQSLMGSLAAQAAIALENARLYSETTRRLTETRALLEVAAILNSTLDSTQLLKRVAIKIAQVCRVDRCSLELWDGDRVIPLMSQFADGRPRPELWQTFVGMPPYAPREVPAHARALESRRPVVVDDATQTDQIPRIWVERFGIQSYMVVPLLRQEDVIGVMHLDYIERVTPFQDWQQDLAMAIGGQVGLSLENTRLYAEAKRRLHETSTLLAVGRALSEPGAPGVAMPRVAAEVGRAFGADMVGAYFLDERRERLVPVGGYHVPKELFDFFVQRPIVLERWPWLRDTWRTGRAAWSSDVHADPRFDSSWTAVLPPHSVLFVPTFAHGEPMGGLFLVWWHVGRTFSDAEIRLVEGIGAQVGLAMENADLARQTQQKLAETQTLLEASRPLSSTLDLGGLVRHFLRTVARTLGADCVGAWLLGEDGEWLEPFAGYHVPRDMLDAFRSLRVSIVKDPFYAEAASRKRSVVTSDAGSDSRLSPSILERAPHRSQVFVPIIAKDRMIGGFAAVWFETARAFTPGELTLLEAVARQAGVAMENARLFQENRRRVEELSVLHALSRAVTGQLDRRAVVDAIQREVSRVLDARNMVAILRDDERQDLEVVLRVVDGRADMHPPLRYAPAATGLVSVVLDEGRALRTDDYAGECARRGLAPIPSSAGLRRWLGVPLSAGDRVLGVLVLRGGDRPFTEADERLLGNIAHLAALALSSARLYEERTRAYGELSAAQDQLVRTEKLRALGEMASGVAHDFNNLLASVLGRAQLLLRRVQEPQLRQWLEVIERAALDGAQTVKRLQEFTRIRRDQPLVPLDLNAVVQDALDMTQSRWREEPLSRGITIEVRTSLAPLPPVAGDAAELREAMTNLILNALDAMPNGGTLRIATAAPGDEVVVTVEDSGTGIPPEVREKIFDPFFTTKGPHGTGLGLSMTYGIVSRHGATITVDSEPARGSVFRLVFPRTPEPAPPADAGDPTLVTAVRPLRCLVVDDEPAVRTVLGDILMSAGHHVVAVADGAEAITRFRAEPFDLVLTDLAMPRVSGWQVARAVKQAAPRVPVFLVTGFGVELSSEEQHAHGVDAVLVKPLQVQEVLDAVAGVARVRPEHG